MGYEIERKWLVKRLNEIVPERSFNIVQGYVMSSKTESLRIRQVQDCKTKEYEYFLTIKSGCGLIRNEAEINITGEVFDALYPLTEGKRVRKNRSEITLEEGFIAEVDIFTGTTELGFPALVLVEVEFNSADEAMSFRVPEWFGEEVTNDSKYINANLVS